MAPKNLAKASRRFPDEVSTARLMTESCGFAYASQLRRHCEHHLRASRNQLVAVGCTRCKSKAIEMDFVYIREAMSLLRGCFNSTPSATRTQANVYRRTLILYPPSPSRFLRPELQIQNQRKLDRFIAT